MNQEYNGPIFYIKAILINSANSRRYLEQLILDTNASGSAKKFLKDIKRKQESIERDIMLQTKQETADVIRKEVSENWETMAHENIKWMCMGMDDEKLRKMEEYATELLKN